MEKQQTDFSKIISSIHPPRTLFDATLESRDAISTQEHFFESIRSELEKYLSHLALSQTLNVVQTRYTPKKGSAIDVSNELYIAKVQPIAFTLQTKENDQPVVRFGTYPLTERGRRTLAYLEQGDDLLSRVTF